ncbi:MAG: D-glycero-alpha-D-manno-heptose-1,7-bisphosphate 7-phosphatase [Alphaproteobacteria bacterium]
MLRAVFLDRDGVLTEEVYYRRTGRWEAPLVPEDLVLRPGVGAALRGLADGGYALFLVSNQGAYAKGNTTLQSLWGVHRRLIGLLAAEDAHLKDCFYAFGHPEGVVPHFSGSSVERKPSPYFLLVAAARYEIDMSRSWMVGDQDIDVACGRAAGVRTILVANPHAEERASRSSPDFRAGELGEAAAIIARFRAAG